MISPFSSPSRLAVPAFAQPAAWPNKPVKIVVPAPAGSSLDLIVRAMSDKLGARWSQPVVVENKPGAGGMLGMDVVAKASDGGHTLGIGFNGPIAFAPFLYRKMPYDPAQGSGAGGDDHLAAQRAGGQRRQGAGARRWPSSWPGPKRRAASSTTRRSATAARRT